MIYKTIDLCAGIGGIRRGFELTRCFKNVLSAEIDLYAAATYKHLFGNDPTNDLTSDEFKKHVDAIAYDVLLAGFPCQSFSRVGKKLGFRDITRGTVFFQIADIISRTTPRAVFLENVENLVSHDHGNTIETIIRTLEDELGYRIIGVTVDEEGNYEYSRASLVRNTKDFGLPQNRPRVYIMGFSKKIYGKAIKFLNQQLPKYGEELIFEDVNEILESNVDDKYYMSQGYLDTLKRHKERNRHKGNGFGYCVINKKHEEHPIAYTILATGGSGKERNLIYQPKDNVAGKYVEGKKSVLNNEGIRVMTPTEWGRLQGFIGYAFIDETGRDTFSFPEGTTDGKKYKQFGNSVSIPVIKAMADFMLECFETLEQRQVDIIRALAVNNDFFTKRDVMEMLDLNSVRAGILLRQMVATKELIRLSRGRGTKYVRYRPRGRKVSFGLKGKVIDIAKKQSRITNNDVREMLEISINHANVLLSEMAKTGILERIGRGQYILKRENNI